MAAAEAKFFSDGKVHTTRAYDDLLEAKAKYRGNLNFGAYRYGNDRQFLGVNGKNYYAKPWGNDSSNIQAIINGPAYWKRVYYRPNIAADFQMADMEAAVRDEEAKVRAAAQASSLRKSASDPGLQKPSSSAGKPFKMPSDVELVPDGYANIKETMKPFVLRQGKPRIKAPQVGERLNFFNTMGNKYHMKAGGKNLEWNVCKEVHRSTKNEARFILSTYFRTDTQAVLEGKGVEPMV